MTYGDLGEAGLPAGPGDEPLVFGIFPGMHEDDGNGVDAIRLCLHDLRHQGGDIQRSFDAAVGAHPFIHFDNAFIELLGKYDLLGEDVRPRLVGDAQRVAKALGDQEQDAVALALQKRIGRHRRAHLDLADQARRYRFIACHAKQVPNALYRRVAIGPRIFGKQLARVQGPVGCTADDVGEGTASIDPEIPMPDHRSPRSIATCSKQFCVASPTLRLLSLLFCGAGHVTVPLVARKHNARAECAGAVGEDGLVANSPSATSGSRQVCPRFP